MAGCSSGASGRGSVDTHPLGPGRSVRHLGYTAGPLTLCLESAIADTSSGPLPRTPPGGGGSALLVALVVTLVVLGPNLPHLRQRAIGSGGSDALKHVWSQWWAWRKVSSGELPLETSLLYHPQGGPFFSVDLANALLGAPLRGLAEPVTVYNLLLVLHLPLAFLSAFALARHLTGHPAAALVAGVAYAVSAWVLAFALGSGVTETVFMWPLPLVLLCAWQTVRTRGWRAPVAGSVLLVLQAVACPNWALVAGIFLLGGAAVWVAQRPWRLPSGAPFRLDGGAAARIGVVVAMVGLAAVPLYLSVGGTVDGGVYERPLTLFGTFDPRGIPETQALAAAHLFWPGTEGLRIHLGADRLYTSGYVGLGLLVLALLGARKSPLARWGLVAAVVFAVLALGPTVHLDLERSGPGWTNPVYLFAWAVVPLFSLSMHGADRFMVGVSLGLGVAATVGLGTLLERASSQARRPLALGATAVVLLEVLWVSPAPWPVPQVPAVPSVVAAHLEGGSGAVLDLPFLSAASGRFDTRIMLDQTRHARPIPYRLMGRGMQAMSPQVRDLALVKALHAATQGERQPTPCRERDALAALGFGTVVVHTARLEVPAGLVVDAATRCFGAPEKIDGALVFGLPNRALLP